MHDLDGYIFSAEWRNEGETKHADTVASPFGFAMEYVVSFLLSNECVFVE